jgi:hypothetical protein
MRNGFPGALPYQVRSSFDCSLNDKEPGKSKCPALLYVTSHLSLRRRPVLRAQAQTAS